jgi:hypothetical protein
MLTFAAFFCGLGKERLPPVVYALAQLASSRWPSFQWIDNSPLPVAS